MKVITIESSAYQAMMEQITEIAGYIRELKEEKQRQDAATKDFLLNTDHLRGGAPAEREYPYPATDEG